jgi:hypothetical protein
MHGDIASAAAVGQPPSAPRPSAMAEILDCRLVAESRRLVAHEITRSAKQKKGPKPLS